MSKAMRFWPSDVASLIGDIASAIGLGITIYVAWLARNIRHEVQRRARLPDILDAMEALGVRLSEHLVPNSDHGERAELIGRTEGLLNSLRSYSDRDGLESIAVVSHRVTACKGQSPRVEDLLTMRGELYQLIEEVRDQVRTG